jgi:hypothetical protein
MSEGFIAFNSFEEFVEWSDRQTQQSNEHLHDQQRSLTWGSTWIRFWPQGDDIYLLFGRVATLDEVEAVEREHGAGDGEIANMRERMSDSHERGYLHGQAFSVIEPDGEWGDTHRANMWPIRPELYEAMMQFPETLDQWMMDEINLAYQGYRDHVIATRAG